MTKKIQVPLQIGCEVEYVLDFSRMKEIGRKVTFSPEIMKTISQDEHSHVLYVARYQVGIELLNYLKTFKETEQHTINYREYAETDVMGNKSMNFVAHLWPVEHWSVSKPKEAK